MLLLTLFCILPVRSRAARLGSYPPGMDRVLGQPGQVFVRILAILNGRLDQAEYDCTAGGSFRCVGEQEVLPVNDEGFDTSFSPVVAQLQPAIFEVIGQVGLLFFQVGKCLAQRGLRRGCSGLCPCEHRV